MFVLTLHFVNRVRNNILEPVETQVRAFKRHRVRSELARFT